MFLYIFSLSKWSYMFTYFAPLKKNSEAIKKMERITAAFYDSASKLLRPKRTNKMSLFAINMARDFAQIFLQPGNWSLKAGLHFSATFFHISVVERTRRYTKDILRLLHNGGSWNACTIKRCITLLCIPKQNTSQYGFVP